MICLLGVKIMKKLKWVSTFNTENHDHVFKVNSENIKLRKLISSEPYFNVITTNFQVLFEEILPSLKSYIVTLKIVVDNEEIPEKWAYLDTVYDLHEYCYSIYLSSIEVDDNQKFENIETGMVPPYIEYLIESKS